MQPILVRHHGDRGAAVVVLHGGPGAPGSVAGLARALASDHRVLEPLQRRSGEVPLTVEQHVRDLADVLSEPVPVVGWSWGAMLALSFAARHPSLVRSIALVGCGTYDEESRAVYRQRMDERLGEEGRSRFARLKQLAEATNGEEERDRILSEMGELATRAQAFDLLPEDGDDGMEVDAQGHEETWQDVLCLQAEGVEPYAFREIRAPVCMLHGAEDPHPGPETRRTLEQVLPGIEYVEFARCGHTPWAERHARASFLSMVRGWLLRTST